MRDLEFRSYMVGERVTIWMGSNGYLPGVVSATETVDQAGRIVAASLGLTPPLDTYTNYYVELTNPSDALKAPDGTGRWSGWRDMRPWVFVINEEPELLFD